MTAPTVPAPRPCAERAAVDAALRADDARREAARALLGVPVGRRDAVRAQVAAELEERRLRVCACEAPAVGRTGQCQGCAIAAAAADANTNTNTPTPGDLSP